MCNAATNKIMSLLFRSYIETKPCKIYHSCFAAFYSLPRNREYISLSLTLSLSLSYPRLGREIPLQLRPCSLHYSYVTSVPAEYISAIKNLANQNIKVCSTSFPSLIKQLTPRHEGAWWSLGMSPCVLDFSTLVASFPEKGEWSPEFGGQFFRVK